MQRIKNGKRAWMGVLAEYYGAEGEGEGKNKVMDKWRNLHYHGRNVLVKEMLNVKKGEVFLDCGCGPGRLLTHFEKICLTIGIDISTQYCHISKISSPHSLIIQGDFENLPFKDESIDVCAMIYTFIYVPNKINVLKEIHRLLKNGGKLIIFDPNRLGLRNFLRNLQVIKQKISRSVSSPSDLNRLLVTTQSWNIFGFKKMASEANLNLDSWCGNFDTIPFPMITEGWLSKVTLFLFWLWEKLGCNKWGKLPLLRFFSDFLIIRFIKRN